MAQQQYLSSGYDIYNNVGLYLWKYGGNPILIMERYISLHEGQGVNENHVKVIIIHHIEYV